MTEPKSTVPSLYLREEELRRGAELLFFASRDMAAVADAVLAEHDLGRAHQRALHFIGRNPGLSVGDLLDILKITKQSLNRVVTRLVDDGYIEQRAGARDRRQRLLYATDKGKALAARLEELQLAHIAAAYRAAGPQAVGGFWDVLEQLTRSRKRPGVRTG